MLYFPTARSYNRVSFSPNATVFNSTRHVISVVLPGNHIRSQVWVAETKK